MPSKKIQQVEVKIDNALRARVTELEIELEKSRARERILREQAVHHTLCAGRDCWLSDVEIDGDLEAMLESACAEGADAQWRACMKAVDSVMFTENESKGAVWAKCSEAVREMRFEG